MIETETIQLGALDKRFNGETAEVKVRRPYAAARKIEAAGIVAIPKPGVDLDDLEAKDLTITIDTLAIGLETIAFHVVSWTLKTAGGDPLPTGRDGVLHEDFDDALGEALVKEIERLVAAHKRTKSGVDGATPTH